MSPSARPGWAAVILAAGNGVRMRSERPKALHEVCGLPMLAHVAGAVRDAGFERVIVVAQPGFANSPEFLAAAGSGAVIAVQSKPLGTADAVGAARALADGASDVLVVHADTPLMRSGTLRALRQAHESAAASLTVLTASGAPVRGLGRVVRDREGEIERIVEEADADESSLAIEEVNSGWYAFEAGWLWQSLPDIGAAANGELYLTDLVGIAVGQGRHVEAVVTGDPIEILGVNDRIQLAEAEGEMRERIRRRWMLNGVTIVDPASAYIDVLAELSPDVTVRPNTHVLGKTRIGPRCEVGPDTVLVDTELGEDSRIVASHAESCRIGRRVSVGPFSRLRPGAVLEDDVYAGNYVEIKNSRVGAGTHVGHFSYIGDAVLGKRVNIGAGTVTCNFDGIGKNQTVIGDDAFISSGSMLVAPIEIGRAARTGAGAVALEDIPAGTTAVGVPARLLNRAPVARAARRAGAGASRAPKAGNG